MAMYALVSDVYFVALCVNKPFQILAQLLILSDLFKIAYTYVIRTLFSKIILIFIVRD
jgi:hypothetical protein